MPDGWELCKISELCVLQNGRAFKPSEWSQSGVPIVRIQNLNDCKTSHNYFNGEIGENHHLFGGELLFAWSGTPGTSFGAHIWRGGEAALNQHIFRVDYFKSGILKEYFQIAINYQLNQLISVAHGGAGLQHVTKGVFENTPIPLPPLTEQHRIVSAIESAFAVIDDIECNKVDLHSVVAVAKAKVLSLAIQGKLVSQDPNDEPASVLLERIQTERETLIKTGKIKRNKNESTITRSRDNSKYENVSDGDIDDRQR